MTASLSTHWPKQTRSVFVTPCVIERLRDPGAAHDTGVQLLLVPERNKKYSLLRVTFFLRHGDMRTVLPDVLTPLAGDLTPQNALTETYSILGEDLARAKGRIDAGVQCWPGRTPVGFDNLRPLSTFGATHPDLAAQSQKLASRWGQKSAPFRGHPRMGRPDLDFLFK